MTIGLICIISDRRADSRAEQRGGGVREKERARERERERERAVAGRLGRRTEMKHCGTMVHMIYDGTFSVMILVI
jgi:hypothetical protein